MLQAEALLDQVIIHVCGSTIVETIALPDGRVFRVVGHNTASVTRNMWRMLKWTEKQEMERLSARIRRALKQEPDHERYQPVHLAPGVLPVRG